MIEVEMTKDIRDYENKLFGVITLRQLILLGIGLAYSIPITLLLPIKDVMNKIFVGAILIAPMIMMGWVSVYGMRLEQFVIQVMRSLVLTPANRKYKIESSVRYLDNTLQTDQAKKQKKKITTSKDYPSHK